MKVITDFFDQLLSQLGGVNFSLLIVIDLCAFAAVFAAALLGCIFSESVRAHGKRAFLYAVNVFTALTLALFLSKYTATQAIAAAALFWCAGYLAYGVLCLFKPKSAPAPQAFGAPVAPAGAIVRSRPVAVNPSAPVQQPAASGVRLEHALSITDKLLLKNLGRGDRQELEKIKTALTVLKVKGVLSSNEGEALNDMFNALLKLMAKYDL